MKITTNGLKIPFTGLQKQYHNLRTEILAATDEVLRSGQLMNGNYTAEFENWLARKNHSKYAVTCHSGTQALEIIANYFATDPGLPNPPRVLIPSMTYSATANAFMRAGWDIHFVDTDQHGIFDVRKVPDDNYQAVVLVGLYGMDITHLGDIKTWRNWTLGSKIIIEDAAQNWLAADCTRIGRASAISFDPMKNLPAYGNGGAVITGDSDLFHYARSWRDNGKSDNQLAGSNSRMSELDCALMMVKAQHLADWQTRRRDISKYWMDRLKNTGVRCLIDRDNHHSHAYHKFVIEVDDRDQLQKSLALRNIETRIHYAQPLHEIGCFRQWPGPDILSRASALSRRVLSLPIYPELTDLAVEYIIDQVLECANKSG